jgi:MarR family 2-MHQ and catechol resistance regulon transcriptional repressor
LWIRLARAYRAIESLAARDVARHGLTLAEFGLLEALYHLGPLSLGTIQKKILVSSGGVTYVADSLESRGLIRREPSPGDRRVRMAVLTAEGRDLIERIFPEHANVLADSMAVLSRTEQEKAGRMLRLLEKSNERMGEE